MSLDTDPQSTPAAYSDFVPEDVAAARIGVKPRKLQYLRQNGNGPPFYKFGQLVRYRVSELLGWAAAQRRDTTAA